MRTEVNRPMVSPSAKTVVSVCERRTSTCMASLSFSRISDADASMLKFILAGPNRSGSVILILKIKKNVFVRCFLIFEITKVLPTPSKE